MTISEAVHIIKNNLPAHPTYAVRYASWVVASALSQDLEREWHSCKYEDHEIIHDGTWVDGCWYEWLDKYNNREIARMKTDMFDHFFPPTKIIKEENIIAFRESRYNYILRNAKESGRDVNTNLLDPDF